MKPLTLAVLLIFLHNFTIAQSGYWQQELDYDITVNLDDSTNTLDGFLKLEYTNNSPDTLTYIWFHLWPNAYKNDRTAFSDQLLENGRADFYFADDARRGYINRMDFRINQVPLQTEDHPNYIDIIKVNLLQPLIPGGQTTITTPFHIKLPYNYSRSGRFRKTYQVTQWYPKPAVYDKEGWHEMPYLDQGEFYSEFGNYRVKITVPEEYIVAATGEQDSPGADSTNEKQHIVGEVENTKLKTLLYQQKRVHDFAWFADKNFIIKKDSIRLASGKTVKLQVYHHQHNDNTWENSISYLSDAIKLHSEWIGEYPYNTATVVEGKQGFDGGMEYPTITILNNADGAGELDRLIFHEVGHNWFYGILATNERQFPWMDEGLNTYFDNRYLQLQNSKFKRRPNPFTDNDFTLLAYETMASLHLDQPVNTPADQLSEANAAAISYGKTAAWLKAIEDSIGKPALDSGLRYYYQQWQFKHPYPQNLKESLEAATGQDFSKWFASLNQTGMIADEKKRTWKLAPFVRLNPGLKHNYLFIAPLPGFNAYDGFMLGALIHNYTVPVNRFNFAVAPLYGFKSKALNGIGRLAYSWYPNKIFRQIELSVSGARFTKDDYTDESGERFRLGFMKAVPGIRLEFKEKSARSTLLKYIQFRQFLIKEDQLDFYTDTVQDLNLARKVKTDYGISQLKLVWDQYRKLYPYRIELQMEASGDFGRLSFTGNYFFNYRQKGGVQLRLFAGKFFYFSSGNNAQSFETSRFHLNMTGPKGDEDYTYSNYFMGRNEFDGFYSQQIMMRDGAFKVRTDFLSNKIGKTDDWLGALNIVVDIPDRFNPLSLITKKIPLRIFTDIGTYAEVWDKDAEDPRFVFDAGLQVSLFRSAVNIYIPIIYSKVYSDYFKSVPGNKFFNRISFSIDLPDLSPRKLISTF